MKSARHLNSLLKDVLLAIDKSFEGEECLPIDLSDVYEEAREAIGYPIVLATMPDGYENRYQLLQDAIDGEEWPPAEWVDSGGLPDEKPK